MSFANGALHTAEKVFVNFLAVCLRDEHDREFLALIGESRINADLSVMKMR